MNLMMDEEEKPVLVGYLTIKSQNGFSIRIVKKPKYCQLFKASQNGIERLEISDSDNDRNTRIVTLENCVKIVLEQPPANIINVVTKTGQIQLHSHSEATAKEWKIALQSVAFKENQSISSHVLSQNAVIEEDNDLYCSSDSDGIFTVTLIPTNASVKCGLEPKMYTLMLSETEIQLKCYDKYNNIAATWPYRFIRKYGYRDGKFTFEAGRKCDTGEGTFNLVNANPQVIFRCMSKKMKLMKKNFHDDSFKITNGMSDTLSSVFSSLEPGSRSPLFPTSEASFIEGNSPNPCIPSPKSFDTSNSKAVKQNCTPNKPPRKAVPSTINHHTSNKTIASDQRSNFINSNVSSVFIKGPHDSLGTPDGINCKHTVPLPHNRDYERVKDITEAWKKLGTDDISHTENIPTDSSANFLRERSKSSRELKSTYQPESSTPGEGFVGTKPIDDNYDTLDFFRTTPKVSLGYTTIVPIPSTNKQSVSLPQSNSSSLDDYEIIGDPNAKLTNTNTLLKGFDDKVNQIPLADPDTSACRKADDSYLGYGMIRKQSLQSRNSSPNICSTSNNLFKRDESNQAPRVEYATVSSPKKV